MFCFRNNTLILVIIIKHISHTVLANYNLSFANIFCVFFMVFRDKLQSTS